VESDANRKISPFILPPQAVIIEIGGAPDEGRLSTRLGTRFAEENWGAIGGVGVGGLVWSTFMNFGLGAAALTFVLSAIALTVGWYVLVPILMIQETELNDADGRQLRPLMAAFIENEWTSIGCAIGLIIGLFTTLAVAIISAFTAIMTVSGPTWAVNALLFGSMFVGFATGKHVCKRFWTAWGVTDER